jgi:hypothetical protein
VHPSKLHVALVVVTELIDAVLVATNVMAMVPVCVLDARTE